MYTMLENKKLKAIKPNKEIVEKLFSETLK